MDYTCPNCGNTEHSDNAKFCCGCGAKIQNKVNEVTDEAKQKAIKKFLETPVSDESTKEFMDVIKPNRWKNLKGIRDEI